MPIRSNSRFVASPLAAAVALALLPSAGRTADADAPVEFDEVQVHAEKAAALQAERALTPGAVSIVDGETFRERAVNNMSDALRYVSGLWTESTLGGDAVFLSSRGSNLDATDYDGNGVKLLQDGLPVTTADGNNHNRFIDPLAAQFATVARGANGMSYGASTLGGAIDFVTPTGLDRSGLDARLNGGSHGFATGRARLEPDVFVVGTVSAALAVREAAPTLPIVFVNLGDPVGAGLAASLARPGGNVTGVSLMAAEAHGKCVEVFADMLPSVRKVVALGNASDPFMPLFLEKVHLSGKAAGVEIAPVAVRNADELEAAFATVLKDGAGALVMQGSLPSRTVAELALKQRLAAGTFTRSFAEVGGLVSYGPNATDSFQRASIS